MDRARMLTAIVLACTYSCTNQWLMACFSLGATCVCACLRSAWPSARRSSCTSQGE